ncbi:MAG: hypothetical protein K9N21_22560 [Deltaproteobacteria bacterium]|nr:hypothetical protein [Deltaproteobacteria bacterium]
MKNFLILLCLAVITLSFPSVTISAGSADVWARQFLIPDAGVLWSQETGFSECFSVGNDKQWHHCADTKKPISEAYVTKKVDVEYPFKVPASGRLYSVLEAHIEKGAWLYTHVKLFLYKYHRSQGQWVDVNIRTYSALFKGQTLLYDRPEARKIERGEPPVQYVNNTDGSITLMDQLPIYEPGDYKILLRAADRGPTVYLPSQARAAVYLIPDDPSALPDKSLTGSPSTLPPAVSGNADQGNPSTPVGSLAGDWKMTCVATGITYKFDLHLKQFGERIAGHMIRTNGQEINTKVEGRVHPDGSIDFIRSTGGWRQHYVGKVMEVSGDKAVGLGGRFGNAGHEKFEWSAERFK